MQQLRAAFFIITPTGKQSKCPSKDEWVKSCGMSIHTMEKYYAKQQQTSFYMDIDNISKLQKVAK